MTQTRTASARPATEIPPGSPSVLAVVVTHNGREWLRETLIGLANQSYPLLDVLVVDDASADHRRPPALKRLAKRHLRRRRWGFLRTPRPLGFGAAANWALSRVRTDADLLLFVHDDAELEPQSVERMVGRLEAEPETAIVGPKIVNWDDPEILEEVGMAADRFGYPYKGLDEGEIDSGQHDRASEVFYVTSTCMLVRHAVFRQLRGWDARMKAFSEDLDLCWRARVAGHVVRFEPEAKARHAMGMATGRRESPFSPTRYYIRRNRLRAVTKNASSLRLLGLIPQYLLLTLAEMVGFAVLRQPGEILALGRAMLWNLVHLPQTLGERARVQRRRKVPDRKLAPLTVRESTRLRAYLQHQAQRLEEGWGRRAEVVARRGAQARDVGRLLSGPAGLLALAVLAVLALGFRHILWAPPAKAIPPSPISNSFWAAPAAPSVRNGTIPRMANAGGCGPAWPRPAEFHGARKELQSAAARSGNGRISPAVAGGAHRMWRKPRARTASTASARSPAGPLSERPTSRAWAPRRATTSARRPHPSSSRCAWCWR